MKINPTKQAFDLAKKNPPCLSGDIFISCLRSINSRFLPSLRILLYLLLLPLPASSVPGSSPGIVSVARLGISAAQPCFGKIGLKLVEFLSNFLSYGWIGYLIHELGIPGVGSFEQLWISGDIIDNDRPLFVSFVHS